jgi:hypothetical protein
MKAVRRVDFELNRRCAGTFRMMFGNGMGRLLLAVALGAAGASAGCGSKTATAIGRISTDADIRTDADFSVCSGTPAVHYAPGISVLSDSGAYRAAILTASTDQGSGAPVPTAAIGYDTFTVSVTSVAPVTDGGAGTDAGAPPEGLTMTTPPIGGNGKPADPYMPVHLHGASTIPSITAQGGGAFSVAAIDFFMAGYWELYLQLTPPGGAADPLTFKICIPDD